MNFHFEILKTFSRYEIFKILELFSGFRYVQSRPFLSIRSFEALEDPILVALLDANILACRFSPTRLIIIDQLTNHLLSDWLHSKYDEFSWRDAADFKVKTLMTRKGIQSRFYDFSNFL